MSTSGTRIVPPRVMKPSERMPTSIRESAGGRPDLEKRSTDKKEEPTGACTAVVVCHGMGQQVPFETADVVARALRDASGSKAEIATGLLKLPLDDKLLARPEVKLKGTPLKYAQMKLSFREKDGTETTREVHVFEAYWAPLTENQVTLRDVVAFCWQAAWNGFRNGITSARNFERWMFDDWQRFKSRGWAVSFQLLLAALVLTALIVLNTTIIAVAAARSLTGGTSGWPSNALLTHLTLDLLLFVVPGSVAGALLFTALRVRHRVTQLPAGVRARCLQSRRRLFLALEWPIWTSIAVAMVVAVLTALLVLFHLWFHQGGAQALQWARCDWPPCHLFLTEHPPALPGALILAVWGVAIGISAVARWFIVQYFGDVVAYVSSHRVDRFHALRSEIKDAVREVAGAVYLAGVPNRPVYDSVVVVGHSLGSVAAYDVLNALVNLDCLLKDEQPRQYALDVAERTELLLTFGSPLDKTAFVFKTQKPHGAEVREMLAATIQPLIQGYEHRPRRWVNLWSYRDWISGTLDFYDKPCMCGDKETGREWPQRVENLPDPDATIPILAHTSYWDHPLFAKTLYEAVTASIPPEVRSPRAKPITCPTATCAEADDPLRLHD